MVRAWVGRLICVLFTDLNRALMKSKPTKRSNKVTRNELERKKGLETPYPIVPVEKTPRTS